MRRLISALWGKLVPFVLLALFHVLDGHFFEDGVLLQFLFDQGFQLERGRLQERQRLLELRRQHLLERHFLRKIKALSHDVIFKSELTTTQAINRHILCFLNLNAKDSSDLIILPLRSPSFLTPF